jgi:hypothetical protein
MIHTDGRPTVSSRRDAPLQRCVAVSWEMDCDGESFAYHRFLAEHPTIEAARKDQLRDGISSYHDICQVVSEAEFLRDHMGSMDTHDLRYWMDEGYYTDFHARHGRAA